MRKAIMIVGLILALGVLAPATALGKAGGTDRPVQGSGSGTTVLDLPSLTFTADATGVMSHLGQTTYHFENGVLTPTGPSSFDITISVTITAANGDQLFGDISGSGTNVASGGSQGTTGTRSGSTGATGASGGVVGRSSDAICRVLRRSSPHVQVERHDQLLAKAESRRAGPACDVAPPLEERQDADHYCKKRERNTYHAGIPPRGNTLGCAARL